MSIQLANLCSVIIEQHFGEKVRIVSDDLFASISKTIPLIVTSTKLPKREVTHALAILIKFRLVKFEATSRDHMAQYSLDYNKVLMILRYGRYVHLIQTKFDHMAASLTEELLRAGTQTASNCILKTVASADSKEKYTLAEVKDKFHDLVQRNYFIRAPYLTSTEDISVPTVDYNSSLMFAMPDINVKDLLSAQQGNDVKLPDMTIYWMVNMDKFHLDFRDTIMMSAANRQLDANSSECLKYILQLMYTKTEPWQITSNPISAVEIRQLIEKRSTNKELVKYLDQYLSILETGTTKYIIKGDDMGGGQYIIDMLKLFEQLTWCCVENIITEKFGTKAARIFRVVRFKKYIEQEDIQKEAMVPSREAKQLTYRLMEENYIKVQVVRKTPASTTGPAKAFYLFHVNLDQVVAMLMETCYKALHNSITRSSYDKAVNRRLIDKSQRMESIVEAMKERGESEEYIADILDTLTPPEKEILQKVKLRVKSLYSAEIGLDETIFLLNLYQYYKSLTLK